MHPGMMEGSQQPAIPKSTGGGGAGQGLKQSGPGGQHSDVISAGGGRGWGGGA